MRTKSTDCTKFQELFSRELYLKFDQERTSSDGGSILLKAADNKLRLSDNLSGSIAEKRSICKINHSINGLIKQRIYAIGSGYADTNDAAKLSNDPVHKLNINDAKNSSKLLASQPTLSRFENSVNTKDLYRIGVSILDTTISHHRNRLGKSVKKITIDMDSTDDPTHGSQQLTFFHGYYMKYCYLPVMVFATFDDEREQHLLSAILRPGNVHDTYGAVPILKRILSKLKTVFPNAEIQVRMDAGYAAPDTFDFLESEPNVKYAIGMAKNNVLKQFTKESMERVNEKSTASDKTEKEYGECLYSAKTWKKERRVIFKAEVVRHPERLPRNNERFVVTNMKDSSEWIYSKFYTGRGDVENRIKELLLGVEIDRTSCSRFLANQFRVFLAAATYILLQEIRRNAADTSFESTQAWMLILRLIKISVTVVHSVRRIIFHMPKSYPDQRDFIKIISRIVEQPG